MTNPILLCRLNIHSKKIILVFIARDGQEALDILNKQLPDVIILDVWCYGWRFLQSRNK
jgi:chemotaxis response regulator CheB